MFNVNANGNATLNGKLTVTSGITGTSNPFSALGNAINGAINNSNSTYNTANTGGGVNPGYADPTSMDDVLGGVV